MKESTVKIYKASALILVFLAYTILIPSSPSVFKVILDLAVIFLAIYLFKEDFKYDFTKLKDHKLKSLGIILLGFIIIVVLQAVLGAVFENVFHLLPPSGDSQISLLKTVPWYLVFSMLIFSPIVEELTFRKAFRSLIRNKFLYILISSIIYGTLYVIFSTSQNISYVFIISYSIIAMVYAIIYAKTENIYLPIFIHILQNVFALLAYIARISG